LLSTEVGNRQIKEQRRRRKVSVGTSGVVADYVPFYFAPRSPMLSAIVYGRVPEYTEGQNPIAYLVSTVERLVNLKLDLVFTDRNAALSLAKFSTDVEALDHLVDWSLMNATYWNNTIEYPDRRERRMAECLVHRSVPWEAFIGVATLDEGRRADAEEVLAAVGSVTPVKATPSWYF
jgi:hypothetical protein